MKKNLTASVLLLWSCANPPAQSPGIGSIERMDASLDAIVSADARIEVIATGCDWSEGPLWIDKYKMLLFSDIPKNAIYKWTEQKGKGIYLSPSGYTGAIQRGGETGSNGLILDRDANLVLCQHGNRQMARMDAPLDKPVSKFISLANGYNGKKLNSPNDAVYNSKGELFFTDPPYGLEKNMTDPTKEIPFQGVYKVKTDGTVMLLIDSITRPNGIAFFPGEKRLLIANSDPEKPYWYAYDIDGNGDLQNGSVFYDASGHKNLKGLPDGLKIDKNGNVFATGPGGIWIFNANGKLIGKISVPEATSNCAFSADEKTLFVTNDMHVLRIQLRK